MSPNHHRTPRICLSLLMVASLIWLTLPFSSSRARAAQAKAVADNKTAMPAPLKSTTTPFGPVSAVGSRASEHTSRTSASESYGKLPLSFEANQGQTDPRVKFISRGDGYSLFMTPTEAVLTLREGKGQARRMLNDSLNNPDSSSVVQQPSFSRAAVLRMKLVGANPSPQVSGIEQLPGTKNYFIGNDPAKWQTDVPSFARVGYRNVYPGVDIIYYGSQRQLEYDLIVAPGAEVKPVALAFESARKLRVDSAGDLVVSTSGGDVCWRKPVAYQEVNGARKFVASSYALRRGHQVGFAVAAYDRSKPLIIDPILSYATYLGGNQDDQARGLAVDAAGSIYVTGFTKSLDFPLSNAADSSNSGATNAFITKLSADGSQLIYSTYLGGSIGSGINSPSEFGNAIAVDAFGSAYVTGSTTSTDFPVSSGAFQPQIADGKDAFVVKLSPTGSIAYATYLGGVSTNIYGDEGYGIAVDTAGNAYITGSTDSQDNPGTPLVNEDFPTANAFQVHVRTGSDPRDAFFTKLSPGGSALVYSSYLAGAADEVGNAIALDANGNAYITGATSSNDFPVANAFQPTYGGTGTGFIVGGDTFITKVNNAGQVDFSSYLGGSYVDTGTGIAIDPQGDAYVTGYTFSIDFPTTAGAFQTTKPGFTFGAFVTKVSSAGNKVYATYLGGDNENDQAHAIAVDATGHAYVTGFGDGFSFPLVQPLNTVHGVGTFVTEFNPNGSSLVYSTRLSGDDLGYAIAVDSAGSAYVAGYTNSTTFSTVNPIQATNHGASDVFIAKITAPPVNTPAGTNVMVELGGGITVIFDEVTAAGNTTVTPLDPNTAGALPSGYVGFGGIAFDISTTSTFVGAVTLSFTAPTNTSPAEFSNLRVLHGEGGMLVDRTILSPDSPAPDFASRTLSARVNSLSPFVLALLTNRPPLAMCKDIQVTANDSCSANISSGDVDNGSFDPDAGDSITTRSLDSTGPFNVGSHTVTLTVADTAGASNSCNATVTVVDRTPPTISCPLPITTEFTNPNGGAAVTFAATAMDNCSGPLTPSCSMASGSTFPIGSTNVSCTATDASSNAVSCVFNVTVLGPRSIKQNVLNELIALRAITPNRQDRAELDEAIRHLTRSLEPALWLDETHLKARGERAFDEAQATIGELRELIRNKKSTIPDAVLQGFINRIVKVDRLLATVAINEAIAANGDRREIAKAIEARTEGDSDVAGGQPQRGIEDYSHAWTHALKALGRG